MQSKDHTYDVFLVDDDALFLSALRKSLSEEKNTRLQIRPFTTGEECLPFLSSEPAVVVLDYYLNGQSQGAMNGMEVLKKIREVSPETAVIILSAQDNVEVAIDTIRNGAYDYIVKSKSAVIRLKNLVSRITANAEREKRNMAEKKIFNRVNMVVFLLLAALFLLGRIL